MSRKTARWLGLIIALGGLVRCWQLLERSLWFDEAFSCSLIGNFSWPEMIRRTARDVHPPLYYVLLRLWSEVLGSSPLALRGLSVLFGEIAIVLMFLFARQAATCCEPFNSRVCPNRIGLVAALLLALSAEQIRWSQEIRMYSLGVALALLSAWTLLRALESPSLDRRWWVGYFLAALALILTHNYGLFTVLGEACWALGLAFFRSRRWEMVGPHAGKFRAAVITFLAVFCGCLPWLRVVWDQQQEVQKDYWIAPITLWTIPDAWRQLCIPRFPYVATNSVESVCVFMGVLAVLAILALRRSAGNLLIIVLATAPVILSAIVSRFMVPIAFYRYFLFAHAFVLAGIAVAVGQSLPASLQRAAATLMAMNCLAVCIQYSNDLAVEQRPGVRGAMAYVQEHLPLSDRVLVTNADTYLTAKYYGKDRLFLRLLKPAGVVSNYLGGPLISDADLAADIDAFGPSCRRIWVLGRAPQWKFPEGFASREWTHSENLTARFQEIFGSWLMDVHLTLFERSDAEASEAGGHMRRLLDQKSATVPSAMPESARQMPTSMLFETK